MEAILAVLAAVSGALLISWSVLLYQTEERSIANALASWWIRVDDIAISTTARNKVWIRDVASALARWLDNIFGERLFSTHALAVSICLSFSSIMAFFALVALIDTTPDPHNPRIVVVCAPLSILLFNAAVTTKPRHLATIVSSILIGAVVAVAALIFRDGEFPWRSLALPAGIALGVSCDFLVIVLVRRVVTAATKCITAVKAAIIAITSAMLGSMMLCTPLTTFYDRESPFDDSQVIGLLAGLTNLYAGAVAIALLVLNSIFLLQRALWPAIERPLYAMERFGVFQHRRTLFYCGAILIGVGFPSIAKVLLEILEKFWR